MDWFAPTVHFCRVNQSGKGSARRDVGHVIQAEASDGEQIALSRFGQGSLALFKWRTGERTEIPLRNSPGTYSVYWSSDGKRLAAYVDIYPASIIICDTTTWKTIAHWDCGRIGEGSEFMFRKDGTLLQIRGSEINALDVTSLKRFTE
jgi:hypothetical protein